jgi:cell division protein FtsI (penicillin-binding protein 3)
MSALTAFTCIFPADEPKYQVHIMLEDPKDFRKRMDSSPRAETQTGATVIAGIAPRLGIKPRFDLPAAERLMLAASKR